MTRRVVCELVFQLHGVQETGIPCYGTVIEKGRKSSYNSWFVR